MSEENITNMNFFKRIITSITDFEKYAIFAVEKLGKAIIYLVLLILIFSSIISGVFTYKFNNSVDIFINHLKDDLHEITYDNGILNINSRRRN